MSIFKIVVPSSLPFIFARMRVSLATALIVIVIAEMIAGSSGIGYYLMTMQYAIRTAEMYAAIILLALLGYSLNKIFVFAERRILHWVFPSRVGLTMMQSENILLGRSRPECHAYLIEGALGRE